MLGLLGKQKCYKISINKKGNYDLFYAFAVEYMQIVKNLLDDRVITLNTYKHIKKENGEFLAKLYLDYCILKKKSSYKIISVKTSLNHFYSYHEIQCQAVKMIYKKFIWKICGCGRKTNEREKC